MKINVIDDIHGTAMKQMEKEKTEIFHSSNLIVCAMKKTEKKHSIRTLLVC